MNPLTILLNGQPVDLGSPVPSEVFSFSVLILMPLQLPTDQSPLVKEWLNLIMSRLTCSHVSFNNVLIPVEDLVRF